MLEMLLMINLSALMIAAIFGAIYAVREMRQIHKLLNSRFSELIEATKIIAHAAGVEEERERQS